MNYGEILKKSFSISFTHPFLWIYGFLVVGTFNVNFLYFQGWSWEDFLNVQNINKVGQFLQQHPGQLLVLTVVILLFSYVGIFITNWARILLVLSTQKILDSKPLEKKELIKSVKKTQWQVVGISLITTGLMVMAAMVLLAPPFFLRDTQKEMFLWVTSSITFLPLAFALSLINIFGSFYAIIFNKSLSQSINLGVDFFIANWGSVLGMLIVLGIIYIGVFTAGIALDYLLRISGDLLLSALSSFHFLEFNAIIVVARTITVLIFWLFLAILNVIFNTAMMLLFFELVKPIKKAPLKDMAISPAIP